MRPTRLLYYIRTPPSSGGGRRLGRLAARGQDAPDLGVAPLAGEQRRPDLGDRAGVGGGEEVAGVGVGGGRGGDAGQLALVDAEPGGVAAVQRHLDVERGVQQLNVEMADRKSTRLNSSHVSISYAVFCLK